MIKKAIKKGLKQLGYKVHKINDNNSLTMFSALARCINRGLEINTVIDVGASDGRWTRECMNLIPAAKYLLIEAQVPHGIELEKLRKEKANVEYVLAAAGSHEGKTFFDNSSLLYGMASKKPFEVNCIEVPVVRIDDEVSKRGMSGPYLIKLDTHGFEIPIIEGSLETLAQSDLVIIEAYNSQLTDDSLMFYQMCDYMDKKGFLPIEIVDLLLRKHDNSLWQMDIFFMPKSHKEFKYKSYV
jgi:FkbM family methyltransferase